MPHKCVVVVKALATPVTLISSFKHHPGLCLSPTEVLQKTQDMGKLYVFALGMENMHLHLGTENRRPTKTSYIKFRLNLILLARSGVQDIRVSTAPDQANIRSPGIR